MAALEIRLFGTLSLERDGQRLARLASRKASHLLAYLVVNRDAPHTRERLAGVFWNDADDERARHSLNTTVWRLQRGLSETAIGANQSTYLRVNRQEIAFNTSSNFWVDVAEFESRCLLADQAQTRSQRAALLRQAVSFYRGDLLTDCYDDWCVLERERLACLYLRALAQLLAFHSERGEDEVAADCARKILAVDPLREEVHQELIRLHLRAGQPAAAVRQYRSCEELLRRELAVEPDPATSALVADVLSPESTGLSLLRIDSMREPALDASSASAQLRELLAECDATRDRLQVMTSRLSQLTHQVELLAGYPGDQSRVRQIAG